MSWAAKSVQHQHTPTYCFRQRVGVCGVQYRQHVQHSPHAFALLARPLRVPPPRPLARLSLESAAAASGKRAAPFPRRPQPIEKPRLAPPHSTRSIRAAPATGRDKMRGKDQPLFSATAVAVDIQSGGHGGGGGGHEDGLVRAVLIVSGIPQDHDACIYICSLHRGASKAHASLHPYRASISAFLVRRVTALLVLPWVESIRRPGWAPWHHTKTRRGRTAASQEGRIREDGGERSWRGWGKGSV